MKIDQVKLLAFKARMVEIANRHSAEMREMTPEARSDYVKRVVERAQVAFGVWQDDKEPDGVGIYLIKGSREMQAATIEKQDVKFRTAAVPCVNLEEAVATRRRFGDDAHKAS